MQWSRRELWTQKLLYPGHTFPTAAAPVIVATGLAIHNDTFAPMPAFLALVAGWLIQFAGVVTDNYGNLVRQPEDSEHPEMVEAIRSGLLSLTSLKATIAACYALSALAGLYLVAIGGVPVLVIGALSIVASLAYSTGPWPVGRIGLGDPLFFLFFGVASVTGTYYVQAAAVTGNTDWQTGFPPSAFAVSLPVGALITNILIIDDIRDRDFDAIKGKATVAVRYGSHWSRIELVALTALAYVAPFWFWLRLHLGPWTLLPLLTLPFAYVTARAACTRDRYGELLPLTPRAAMLALTYSILLAIGLAVGVA